MPVPKWGLLSNWQMNCCGFDTNEFPIFDDMTKRRTEIKKWLAEVLEKNLTGINYRAFIFGSQANKSDLIRSDIDLGILSDSGISPDCLVRIDNAIEDLPMLYKIDLVDFNNVGDRFKAAALKNVEWL